MMENKRCVCVLSVDDYLAGCDGRARLTKGPKWANHGSLLLLLFVLHWQTGWQRLAAYFKSIDDEMHHCRPSGPAQLTHKAGERRTINGRMSVERKRPVWRSVSFSLFFLARWPTATRRHLGRRRSRPDSSISCQPIHFVLDNSPS